MRLSAVRVRPASGIQSDGQSKLGGGEQRHRSLFVAALIVGLTHLSPSPCPPSPCPPSLPCQGIAAARHGVEVLEHVEGETARLRLCRDTAHLGLNRGSETRPGERVA